MERNRQLSVDIANEQRELIELLNQKLKLNETEPPLLEVDVGNVLYQVAVMRECGLLASARKKKGKQTGKRTRAKTQKPTGGRGNVVVAPITNMRTLFPDEMVVWVSFNDPTQVRFVAAATDFSYLNLHPNDPHVQVVGTAVAFTGEITLTRMYAAYIVEAWEIEWELANLDVGPKLCYMFPTVKDETGVITTPTLAAEYCAQREMPPPKMVSPIGGGKDIITFKRKINLLKFFGEPIDYKANFSGAVGSSPTNFINCGLCVVSSGINMTNGVLSKIRTRLKIRFYERTLTT